jgi:hypothetical protein
MSKSVFAIDSRPFALLAGSFTSSAAPSPFLPHPQRAMLEMKSAKLSPKIH